MAQLGRRSEPGMESLHGTHARATHPPLQTTHHQPRGRQESAHVLVNDPTLRTLSYVVLCPPPFVCRGKVNSPEAVVLLACTACVTICVCLFRALTDSSLAVEMYMPLYICAQVIRPRM